MSVSLSIYLLGPLRIELDTRLLVLKYTKARALLAYLALEPGFHSRDALADLLWPGLPTHQGRDKLKRMLFHLRDVLGDDTIEASRQMVRCRRDKPVWVDAELFDTLFAPAQLRHEVERSQLSREHLEQIAHTMRLYRGPFLQGLEPDASPSFDQWLHARRATVQQRVIAGMRQLAFGYWQFSDVAGAVRCARRLTEMLPYDESAWHPLLELLMRANQRDEAARELQRCRDTLAMELDAEPSVATLALLAPRDATAASMNWSGTDDRRQLSVVYCGFSASDDGDADDLADILQQPLDQTARILRDAGGYTVASGIGGIFGYFGYPAAIEAAAERAVAAAQEVLKQCTGAALALPSQAAEGASGKVIKPGTPGDAPPGVPARGLTVRVAVHSGTVISAVDRALPDRGGKISGIAAQLIARGPVGQLVISEATLKVLGESVPLGGAASLRQTARTAPELHAEPEEMAFLLTAPLTGHRGRVDKPLFGREALLVAVAEAHKSGLAVLVEGCAGVGKSALLRTYREIHGLAGFDLDFGNRPRTGPFESFIVWLEQLLASPWRETAVYSVQLTEACEALAYLIEIQRGEWPMGADDLRRVGFPRNLRIVLTHLVPAGGMLWLDHLHLVDAASLEFVSSLITAPLADRRLALTARNDVGTAWQRAALQSLGQIRPTRGPDLAADTRAEPHPENRMQSLGTTPAQVRQSAGALAHETSPGSSHAASHATGPVTIHATSPAAAQGLAQALLESRSESTFPTPEARSSAAMAALTKATARSHPRDQAKRAAHLKRVTVEPLSAAEARRLIDATCGGARLEPGAAEHIEHTAIGIPLFIEHYTRAVLADLPQSALPQATTIRPSLPPALHDLFAARLDAAGNAKQAARVAAAIGQNFSSDLLGEVMDLGTAALEPALSILVEYQVLEHRTDPTVNADSPAYRFSSPLMREAAYRSMARRDRHKVHSDIANALIARQNRLAIEHPEIVDHLIRADQTEAACEFLQQTGIETLARGLPQQAQRYFEAALAWLALLPESPARSHLQSELQTLAADRYRLKRG